MTKESDDIKKCLELIRECLRVLDSRISDLEFENKRNKYLKS